MSLKSKLTNRVVKKIQAISDHGKVGKVKSAYEPTVAHQAGAYSVSVA